MLRKKNKKHDLSCLVLVNFMLSERKIKHDLCVKKDGFFLMTTQLMTVLGRFMANIRAVLEIGLLKNKKTA